ncbi:hypothetical protein MPTK2_2g21160 [Marchantia polymorpha subsp. ruderalis]
MEGIRPTQIESKCTTMWLLRVEGDLVRGITRRHDVDASGKFFVRVANPCVGDSGTSESEKLEHRTKSEENRREEKRRDKGHWNTEIFEKPINSKIKHARIQPERPHLWSPTPLRAALTSRPRLRSHPFRRCSFSPLPMPRLVRRLLRPTATDCSPLPACSLDPGDFRIVQIASGPRRHRSPQVERADVRQEEPATSPATTRRDTEKPVSASRNKPPRFFAGDSNKQARARERHSLLLLLLRGSHRLDRCQEGMLVAASARFRMPRPQFCAYAEPYERSLSQRQRIVISTDSTPRQRSAGSQLRISQLPPMPYHVQQPGRALVRCRPVKGLTCSFRSPFLPCRVEELNFSCQSTSEPPPNISIHLNLPGPD